MSFRVIKGLQDAFAATEQMQLLDESIIGPLCKFDSTYFGHSFFAETVDEVHTCYMEYSHFD